MTRWTPQAEASYDEMLRATRLARIERATAEAELRATAVQVAKDLSESLPDGFEFKWSS